MRAYLPEPELGKVALGMRAWIETDSFHGQRFPGWVGFISPVAEFTPKNVETTQLRSQLVYRVRVYACNPDHRLRLGMPATVVIPLLDNSSPCHSRAALRARIDMDAVAVRNLPNRFGKGTERRVALRNVSLRLSAGSMTALIGPDGAGKTTLLRLLAGILTPDAGELRVLDQPYAAGGASDSGVASATCRSISVSMRI